MEHFNLRLVKTNFQSEPNQLTGNTRNKSERERERERERDRQIDRQRDRRTDGQTDRRTDKETEKENLIYKACLLTITPERQMDGLIDR